MLLVKKKYEKQAQVKKCDWNQLDKRLAIIVIEVLGAIQKFCDTEKKKLFDHSFSTFESS